MKVMNSMQISGNAQALSLLHGVSPHAVAQVESKAVKTVSPEQGRAPNKEAEKVSPKNVAEQVQQGVKEMNAQLNLASHSIRFSIDDKSHDLVVKVVDTDTDKVIRQIPAEEILRLRENMKALSGMIMEEEV
jgi:flagellar protein FlaG